MSLWYEVFPLEAQELLQIPKQSLLSALYACIRHAFERNYSRFGENVSDNAVEVVERALKALRDISREKASAVHVQVVLDDIESIAADDDSPAGAVCGWEYIRISVREAMSVAVGSDYKDARRALDAAYQSMAEGEVQLAAFCSGSGLAGQEITEAERKSQSCQDEIAFQLSSLKQAKQGGSLPCFDDEGTQ